MPEMVVPGPVNEERSIREAVCIHTRKIFDSCKDKDIAPYIYLGIEKEGGQKERRRMSSWNSFGLLFFSLKYHIC